MALGSIAVLLIIVVGLASTYIREFKISRATYNDIVAAAGAEGVFEYGMLKIRNHRDGFADTLSKIEPDSSMFALSTERSKGINTSYIIQANSQDETFSLPQDNHLIVPLFVADESLIPGAIDSRLPGKNSAIKKSQNITIQWLNGANPLAWVIVAERGSESIALTGTGDISSATKGAIRHKDRQCYNNNGDIIDCSSTNVEEEILYFWDEVVLVGNFVGSGAITNPYLMVYNTDTTKNIRITAATPFTLPTMTIEATAQKNDSSQVYRFTEDKSRYYDALKYGVYNN